MSKTAYSEGHKDGMAGKKNNPYPINSWNSDSYLCGYNDGVRTASLLGIFNGKVKILTSKR